MTPKTKTSLPPINADLQRSYQSTMALLAVAVALMLVMLAVSVLAL